MLLSKYLFLFGFRVAHYLSCNLDPACAENIPTRRSSLFSHFKSPPRLTLLWYCNQDHAELICINVYNSYHAFSCNTTNNIHPDQKMRYSPEAFRYELDAKAKYINKTCLQFYENAYEAGDRLNGENCVWLTRGLDLRTGHSVIMASCISTRRSSVYVTKQNSWCLPFFCVGYVESDIMYTRGGAE